MSAWWVWCTLVEDWGQRRWRLFWYEAKRIPTTIHLNGL